MLVVFLALLQSATDFAKECDDRSTYEIAVCAEKLYRKADVDLNATYTKALRSVASRGASDVEKLKDAQRKWLAYRDSACDAEYALWGSGSGAGSAQRFCLTELTRERTAHIRSSYEVK